MAYQIQITQLGNGTWEVRVSDPRTAQQIMHAWGFTTAGTAAQLAANVVHAYESEPRRD